MPYSGAPGCRGGRVDLYEGQQPSNKPHILQAQHAQARKGPHQESRGLPYGQQVRLADLTKGRWGTYPAVCKPQKAKQPVPLRSQAWIGHGHLENITPFPNLW